ncbi:MAG: pyridoxal-phosphate dependent enzyme, partial [Planctomycetes bacterium]|nr:pyridoxal-phosphate dependent enzyme [Planctomycetota bacterium]
PSNLRHGPSEARAAPAAPSPPPPIVPEGNLFLDRMAGARITWVTREEYREIDAVYMRLARELGNHGARCYFIPEGGSNALGALGYVRAAEEIALESESFTHVVHAVGSGGTSAGLVLGRRLHGLRAKLLGVAVCDDAGYFYEKIGRIASEATHKFGLPEIGRIEDEIEILDGHIGPGYALSTKEIRETIVEAARTEGLVLDPVYTGKAFHGLVQEIRAGRFSPSDRVLFLHTGGIFGLLAARADFAGEL